MRYVFMRYPGGKPKAVTFSYDDGVVQDRRLAEIFDKYGMKATFNFNTAGKRAPKFTKEEIHEIFLSKGHEIAIHGADHRANGSTRPIEGIRDVLECRLELESLCGRIIRGMAYPDSGITLMGNFGSYEAVKNYLVELDIAYARTLGGDNNLFRLPEDFHAWMPTAHHNNPSLFDWIDEFCALEYSTYRTNRNAPRLMYIWGHSYEFSRDNNWERIEEICEKLSGRDDTWYATNIEIYDYVKAYEALVFSADEKTVYNPTGKTVWLTCDYKIYRIEPCETVKIN